MRRCDSGLRELNPLCCLHVCMCVYAWHKYYYYRMFVQVYHHNVDPLTSNTHRQSVMIRTMHNIDFLTHAHNPFFKLKKHDIVHWPSSITMIEQSPPPCCKEVRAIMNSIPPLKHQREQERRTTQPGRYNPIPTLMCLMGGQTTLMTTHNMPS